MHAARLYPVLDVNVLVAVVKNSLGMRLKAAGQLAQETGFWWEGQTQVRRRYYVRMMTRSSSSLQAPSNLHQIACKIYSTTDCSPWLKLQANTQENMSFPSSTKSVR